MALALAANAQNALCYDLFAGLTAPLRAGNTVVIHYSFAQIDATALSNPQLKHELLMSAQREQNALNDQLVGVKGTSAKAIASRAEINSRLRAVSHLLTRVQAGGRMNQQDLSLISTHSFEQTFAMNGKAGRALLEARLAELEGRIATIQKVDLPKNGLHRMLRVAMDHKVVTFVIVASVASSGGSALYNLYMAPPPLNGKVTAVYQDCGLDDKCTSGSGSGEVGASVAQARAKHNTKAIQIQSASDSTAPVEKAHDDPSLAIGN